MNKLFIVLLTGLTATAAYAAHDGVHVGGFVDAQYHQTTKPYMTEGFNVYDGAAYLSKELGSGRVFVDLPFNSQRADNTSTSTAGANFSFAQTKAQAYVEQKYASSLSWRLGQFDTIYGYEALDSNERFFARTGAIINYVTPDEHAGILMGYDLAPAANFQVLVANAADQGALRQKEIEYGGKLNLKYKKLGFAFGYLVMRSGSKSVPLADFVVDAKLGDFTLALDYNYKKPAPGIKEGHGVEAYVTHRCTDKMSMGARFGYVMDIQQDSFNGQYDTKQMEATAGLNYKLTADLTSRFNYSYDSNTPSTIGTDGTKTHSGVVSAVYQF